MGGSLTYVPSEVLAKYKDDVDMKPVLQTYGRLRKHEVSMHDLFLFDTIAELKKSLGFLRDEIEARRSYTESLEAQLLTAKQAGAKNG